MRTALRLSVLLLALFMLLQFCSAADISGTVRISGQSMLVVPPEQYPAARYSTVTLCSEPRAYRVKGDEQGRFTFQNVQPGSYDLVAALGYSYAPELISHHEVIAGESIGPITALVHDGKRTSPCYVSTQGHRLIADFDVDYDAPDPGRKTPVIQGKALRSVSGGAKKADSMKDMGQAEIQLFRVGESTPLSSTTSDKHGAFTLHPEPGIYELRMTRQGYEEVRVPPFLVPRENVTVIELSAATAGSIVLER